MKNRKNIWIISLIAAIAVIAIVLVVWTPPFVQSLFGSEETPVRVSAKEFVPADTNKALVNNRSRLIIVTDFHATQLNNDRSLHIYLPPSYYKNTEQKFPVLYVHDGKAIFELSDWSKESLNMHQKADKLIADGKIEEIIIVGIDNIGENRVGEYALWDGTDQGKPVTGVGLMHEDFVLNDVKPFIDKNLRTLPDREHTALMGASIGGFSTFNIGFRHPEVFSKLAMQSPYLGWGNGELYGMISDGPYKDKMIQKIWLDVGSTETGFVDMASLGALLLLQNGYTIPDELAVYEAPDGAHSEKYWSERVDSILLFLYGDIGEAESVKLYTDKQISLSDQTPRHINAVITYTSGFKMTDVSGVYSVQKSDLLTIDNFGGALHPAAVGTTEVTYTVQGGLMAKETITIVK